MISVSALDGFATEAAGSPSLLRRWPLRNAPADSSVEQAIIRAAAPLVAGAPQALRLHATSQTGDAASPSRRGWSDMAGSEPRFRRIWNIYAGGVSPRT